MFARICLALTATIAPGIADAQGPQALLQQYKCYSCHADHETKTGPAYVDVAAKYRGKPDAVKLIAAVVRKGAHGRSPWHMPPHPEVSDADARKLASYILSLTK
jgi:cytochrome c